MTRSVPWVFRTGLPVALGAGLALAAAALVTLAALRQEYLVVLVIGGAILLPPALVFVQRAVIWDGRLAFAMSVLLIVAISAVLRLRDIDDKSIDAQILMKLAAVGMMGLMAVTALARMEMRRHSPDFLIWSLFLFYSMLTSLIAVQPAMALVETSSHLAAFVLLYGMARLLGRVNFINGLIASCFILCLMSILAYVAMPSLGRMSDWVNGAFVPTSRLQGVFGTANAAGAAAAIGLILTLFLSDIPKARPLFFALMAAFSICLVLSNNRMSMTGFAAAALYVYMRKGDLRLKLAVGVLLLGLTMLAYLGFGQEMLESLSRSGSADEITSGTGRTRIWTVVLQMWSEQPILGYGAGSAKFILPKNPLLFAAAAHAHDLYLNVLFSGGIVGLGLFLWGLWVSLRSAAAQQDHGTVSLLVFFLVYGITEPTLGGLVSYVPIGFYAAAILAMPLWASKAAGFAGDGVVKPVFAPRLRPA